MAKRDWDKQAPQQWGDHEWPTQSDYEVEDCPRCDGKGRVDKLFGKGDKVCPRCDGSGKK